MLWRIPVGLIFLLQLNWAFCKEHGDSCLRVPNPSRLDCHPEPFATENACIARGCCWSVVDKQRTIACFFPPDYPTYMVTSDITTDTGFSAIANRSEGAYPGVLEPISSVHVDVVYVTKSRLRIRIVDAEKPRWEPPIVLAPPDQTPVKDFDYHVEMNKTRLGFRIFRNDAQNTSLIDSTGLMASAFAYANQFLQIAFSINADHVYGFGEREDSFPLELHEWRRMFFWSRDQVPRANANLYGVHNFFVGLKSDGEAFGVFFLNSNAHEVTKQPAPSFTYRTIGGILDFFIFTGPTPAEVVAQYYELIGCPPVPPYWALGFQLSRYGYADIAEIRDTIRRNREADIPQDVQWFDIDYMDKYKDWTISKTKFVGLQDFVDKELHGSMNMRAVLIVDPAISNNAGDDYRPYKDGLAAGVFVNDSKTGKPLVGSVWPGESVFPDFFKNATREWWFQSAKTFYGLIKYDGIWIDMNEPANFYDGSVSGCDASNKLDNPPYLPQVSDYRLFASTICPSAMHQEIAHYNVHNIYGLSEAIVTREVLNRLLPDLRPFLLTRSSFAGSGRYTYHWTGDVYATWEAMMQSIIQMLNFNIYAMPMIGADICGFVGDTTEELCVRWSQLGAFYPFSRNHNGLGSRKQDPASWSSSSTNAIAKALSLRYQFLPYLYTLLYNASFNGGTVARALFLEFPTDLATHRIDQQFLWGPYLMVAPVVKEGARHVYVYLPEGRWVEVSSFQTYNSKGQWFAVDAPLDVIPLFYRGGSIIPMHPPGPMNTVEARKLGIGITTVLSVEDDLQSSTTAEAKGELFWDDGVSKNPVILHMLCNVQNRTLNCNGVNFTPSGNHGGQLNEPVLLAFVRIIGIKRPPLTVSMDGTSVDFDFDNQNNVLTVSKLPHSDILKSFKFVWSYSKPYSS